MVICGPRVVEACEGFGHRTSDHARKSVPSRRTATARRGTWRIGVLPHKCGKSHPQKQHLETDSAATPASLDAGTEETALKKTAVALALAGICMGAQAVRVTWHFEGMTEAHPYLGPPTAFKAKISFPTRYMSTYAMDPMRAFTDDLAEFSFSAYQKCTGYGMGWLDTGTDMLTAHAIDTSNDCALRIELTGAAIGASGPFDNKYLAWERLYDLDRPGVGIYINASTAMDGGFVAGTITSWRQTVPEPATLVLFGAGLVGLIGWRRRKAT